jgi:type I restriction enzyme M protein
MSSTLNERKTEELVRERLRDLGYYDDESCYIDEQKSRDVEVQKLLKTAGKGGKGGIGSPEFIITNKQSPDVVIVFECKADVKYHESENRDKPVAYAVDGTLWYAKFLSKSYNVIAVAVSGQSSDSARISNFLWTKGAEAPIDLSSPTGSVINEIIPISDYIRAAEFDPRIQRQRRQDLMDFSRELHDFMWKHAKLSESEKPLLVSGTLIALRNKAFANSFHHYKADELQDEWLRVIQHEMELVEIPHAKTKNMTQPYSSIATHPQLGVASDQFPHGVLHRVIDMLAEKVMPALYIHHDFDIVGQFYGEFLKYTGGDKKALGIVLTPRHVTELFALLANVTKTDRVIDPCVGTGGFLISAMTKMIATANTEAEVKKIKKDNLIGFEHLPNMYTLAASNMILRGDGRANLHLGSCFDSAIVKAGKEYKSNVGLINPPYSQGTGDLHELSFVDNMLDMLVPGGIGIAIVPVSCATSPHSMKQTIMNKHTLEAVMSMPNELFAPVGVITCIMVFTAHKPHAQSNRKTWFGYWKDDGFIKTKHMGRVDLDHRWEGIRDRWVEQFRNREVHADESVTMQVTADMEWIAEAYMEPDYERLNQSEFERVLREYAVFSLLRETGGIDEAAEEMADANYQ